MVPGLTAMWSSRPFFFAKKSWRPLVYQITKFIFVHGIIAVLKISEILSTGLIAS